MTKMTKLVSNNLETAIINMLKDFKGKHSDKKRNRKYCCVYKTLIELEYNI